MTLTLTPHVMVFVHRGALEKVAPFDLFVGPERDRCHTYSIIVTRFLMVEDSVEPRLFGEFDTTPDR